MADFSAQDVKRLRDATGAGMMDAKKALVENDGDFDTAAKWLREREARLAAARDAEAAADQPLASVETPDAAPEADTAPATDTTPQEESNG
jgi:elongation factor Ts